MNEGLPPQRADRRQLQQIIAGLTEGVIFIDPEHSIIWANDAALEMHGVKDLEGFGATVTDYRKRFKLRYRNNHPLSDDGYPIERLVAGEIFSDVVVEVRTEAGEALEWVHWVRSLVLTDAAGTPETLVLIIQDVCATARSALPKRSGLRPFRPLSQAWTVSGCSMLTMLSCQRQVTSPQRL